MTLHLHGMGHFHPENEISNAFLEDLDIETNDEWIVERVGIRSRRTVLPLDYIRTTRNRDVREAPDAQEFTTAQLGARAARVALDRAGLKPSDIGLVISGSSSPNYVTPADAAFLAKELDIEVPAFDLQSACTTFLSQLAAIAWIDPARIPDYVLLVATEALTTAIDYDDRGTAVLFGDGAAAAVVSMKHPGRASIWNTHLNSSPAGADKVVIPRTGYFHQEGRAVQMFAIKRTVEGFRRIAEAAGELEESGSRPLHLIGHQANARVLDQVCRRCEIPPDRHHSNVELRGNTGGASAPSVLSMEWEKFGAQDDAALVAVGGGLSWGRALVRFGEAG